VRGGERGGVEQGVLDASKGTGGEKAEVTLEVGPESVWGDLWLIAEVSAVFSPFGAQMLDIGRGPIVFSETPLSVSLLSRHPSQYLVRSSSLGTSPKFWVTVGFMAGGPRGENYVRQIYLCLRRSTKTDHGFSNFGKNRPLVCCIQNTK